MPSTEESKEYLDKLFAQVHDLNREDVVILEDLARQGAASNIELAAHLVLLPSDVNKCLERLSTLGFIEPAPPSKNAQVVSTQAVKLSAQGKAVAGLLPLVEKMKGWA
jgi:DNA-binding MarR family transcriptional regulator